MRKQITGNEEIKLYSWMAQEGLKGNALVVYAIVYDAGEYSGGYRYLADFTGMEINSLIRLVGSMVKQGYLKKEVEEIKNTKIPHLRAVRRGGDNGNNNYPRELLNSILLDEYGVGALWSRERS